MKKTYINPEMEIIEIKAPELLTGSLPVFSDTEITSGDMLAPEFGDVTVEFSDDVSPF